jgi:hypothetical protein
MLPAIAAGKERRRSLRYDKKFSYNLIYDSKIPKERTAYPENYTIGKEGVRIVPE